MRQPRCQQPGYTGFDRLEDVLLASFDTTTWVVVSRCFGLAALCHLLLADAWQTDWLAADLWLAAGAAVLCWRPVAAGWLASAVGLAIGLFCHGDQLTQSLILLVWSSTAALSLMVARWRTTRPTSDTAPKTPQHGLTDHVTPTRAGFWAAGPMSLTVFRGVTIAVYLLAVLHKLNHQFFDPQFSCAVYGVNELFGYWRLPTDMLAGPWLNAIPLVVLAAEMSIGACHLLGRRRAAWQLAAAFHIPLTLTMAPAFAFVMAVGHAAFLCPTDLKRLRQVVGRHGPVIGVAAAATTAASVVAHGSLPEWTLLPREWLLWATTATLLAAFPPWQRPSIPASAKPDSNRCCTGGGSWPARIIVGLFVLHGLTPYMGVQYRHAGAMVSNLRIDRGCWNSLVVPESWRLTDDYVRIDQVYFGAPGRIPDYEAIVADQLWSPPRIRQMRQHWCRADVRPIYLAGTFRGRRFVIDDLCAHQPLPFDDAGMFGVELFGNYLRFQKNLHRQCPQTCIH